MIGRFSLYGFLKNQRYFEPFIVLFFLQKGLSFTQIGFLVALRELSINIMEIPSGAVADLYGRRRCMIISFASYILSFILFGSGVAYIQFMLAMFLFAVGDAFRTGTHKALIFAWLRLQGRESEKTRVYGYTRSWSKLGSAFSIIVATALVISQNSYDNIFYYSIIPYTIGLINFLFYPEELDRFASQNKGKKSVIKHLYKSFRMTVKNPRLRSLIFESMGFEGIFKASKDYLQPVLKQLALTLPILVSIESTRRSAMVVGCVYFVLYLMSALGSRLSFKLSEFKGGEERSSYFLWKVSFFLYLSMIPFLIFRLYSLAIVTFVGLYLTQNFWRPILISRFDAFAGESHGATILSIESQAKSLSTMVVAPLLGVVVDFLKANSSMGEFWPVGVIGAIAGFTILLYRR